MTTNKKIVDFPDLQNIEAEAAALIARLDNDDISAEEVRQLREWTQTSQQHRAAIERMAAIWGESDILARLRDYPPVKATHKPRGVTRRYAGVAAALLLMTAGAGFYASVFSQSKAYSESFETALGEQHDIALPDGSSILLNTNSSLEISYTKAARQISLNRGEAFFDVAADPLRPFRVAAGEGVVEAVGTAFAVRLDETEEIKVTVAEGRVALSALGRQPQLRGETSAQPVEPKKELLEVAANQRAVFAQKVQSLESVEDAAMNRALSWRKGVLIFAGDPLRDVVNEITRYADVEIIIADPALMDTPVGGYFRIGEVDAMLRSLEISFDVQVDRESRNRIVLRKGA